MGVFDLFKGNPDSGSGSTDSFVQPADVPFVTITDAEGNSLDDQLVESQQLIDDFLKVCIRGDVWSQVGLNDCEAGKRISKLKPDGACLVVLACLARMVPLQLRVNEIVEASEEKYNYGREHWRYTTYSDLIDNILRSLLRRKLPLTEEDILTLLDYILLTMQESFSCYASSINSVIKATENYVAEHALSDKSLDMIPDKIIERLKLIDEAFVKYSYPDVENRKVHARIITLVGDNAGMNVFPGEAWSDVAISDIEALEDSVKDRWISFLNFCQTATASKPSAKWKQQAKEHLDAIDEKQFIEFVSRWFPLVDKPHNVVRERRSVYDPDPNVTINDQNMDILKGLTWCCVFYESDDLARAVNALALTSYKKVPGLGPRATRVGNACVYALGEMPGMAGVYQMALLKIRINFRTALNGIEKALAVAGERVGMTVDELEEIGVPAYGLTEVGKMSVTLGDFTAELMITGTTSTVLSWIKADGKTQKSIPKAVKDDFAEELKEIKATAKDIQKMLPAQRQRIDNMFLEEREWAFDKWKQYYLDHPLVGFLSRRLIWRFSNDGSVWMQGCYLDGDIVDVKGKLLENLGSDTKVSLWHPIHSDVDEVKGWREWMESHEVIQPFKQAHREIYLLTDAERTTNSYSNRFAAHIIKQHQFNALAGQRGWKYSLQGCWDGGTDEIARLVLPRWNLWAEFWVDGIGEYGNDTSEAGIFLYVATDQVRFYHYGSEEELENVAWYRGDRDEGPTPIADIPPIVLSEVFRDVDLFVGVASVGNDPEWADGGPEGRYRDYWNSYSFGDLNATAKTRQEVLERLIPRLKIADRCEVTDRFLVVRGDVRSYKIHLGSGNILMAPNDQYLCIVAARGTKGNDNKIFLPFEGDTMMSIILSKAFMLADDKKIKDKTILSQINP